MIMSPIPVPPPVTTAEKWDTSKRFEALSCSFDLTEGLSEDIVLISRRLDDFGRVLIIGFLTTVEEVLVRSLSIVLVAWWKMVEQKTFGRTCKAS